MTRTRLGSWLTVLFGSVAPGLTLAQVVPAGSEPEKMEELVVTGSLLPTPPDSVAVPVTRLDSEDIERGGVNNNVLEILRKEIPSFAGRSNAGNTNANNLNQNTAGGSQVQLRNLDTLVLVDGRRVAISGIAAIGGKAFVDLNTIPAAAIDRIEVLTDGSSAIYGSDAIGGVINVILKSNYEGAEVGGRFGTADGGYRERSAYGIAGLELGEGTNVTVTASEVRTSPLAQNARPFSSPLTGRLTLFPGVVGANGRNPGAILAPGLSSPADRNPTGTAATATSIAQLLANGTYLATTPAGAAATFDASQYQQLLLRQDQTAVAATGSTEILGKELVAFGDLEFAHTQSFTQFLPITTTVTVPQAAPYNPLQAPFPLVTFGVTGAPRQFYNDGDAVRVTAGLRGDLSRWLEGWSWEAAYTHSQDDLEQRQPNLIYRPNVARAIAGGYDAAGNPVPGGPYSRVTSGFSEANPFVIQPALNPFARSGIPGASLANLIGTEVIDTSSQLDSADVRVIGTVGSLPGGKTGVAIGLAYRREALSALTDPNSRNTGPTAQQFIGGTYADPFSKDRRIKAAFVEVRVPVFGSGFALPGAHELDLIAAGRAEDYSDAGFSKVPKAGFRWQPLDAQVTLRGTYSKSFTAPTLYAEYGPTDTRQIGAGVIQSVFGLSGLTFNGEDGNNPNLKPSHSQTRSVGVTLAPDFLKGLKIAVDYSAVDQKGFPGGIGFTNILQSVDQLGSASPFSANLALGNFPGLPGATAFTAPGQVGAYLRGGGDPNNLYAIDQFRNLGGLKVRSFTLGLSYEFDTRDYGRYTLGTQGAIFDSFRFQALPGQKFYEYAGYVTNGGTGVQGTIPRYRFYTQANASYDDFDFTVGNTFISAVTDIGPGGIVYETSTTLHPIHVSHYVSWDLRLAYTARQPNIAWLQGWTLAVGVNNVGNELPPLAPQAYTDNNADVSTYSPIGRLLYVTASVKF